MKAVVAYSSGCDLTGARIEVYDETDARLGGATVWPTPWPLTRGLYWAELDVAAPDTEGDHAWRLQATALEPVHARATSVVRVVASRPPEHRVALAVIEKGSGAPVAGVELRVGRFSTATNEAGTALVDVPGGTYDVVAWKVGYDLFSTVHVTADTRVSLEITVTPEPEQPYWM